MVFDANKFFSEHHPEPEEILEVKPDPKLDEYLSSMGGIEIDEADFKYGVAQAKALETGNKCTPDDWKSWLNLRQRQWTPKQAVCLLYGISPSTLKPKKYPNAMTKLLRLAKFSGDMTPYQWKQFGLEQGIPLPQQILDIQETAGQQSEPESVKDEGLSIYEQRKESFDKWRVDSGVDIVDLTDKDTLKLLKQLDKKLWNITLDSYRSEFWNHYKKANGMKKKRGRPAKK
jgi:hypothetical protein